MKFSWLISDVDGILTCGGHFYDIDGKRFKRFGSNDPEALKILKQKYVDNIVFITSDKIGYDISKKRINYMGYEVKYFELGEREQYILSLYGDKIFLGDGIKDSELFKYVNLSFALEDSTPQAKSKCSHILPTNGGYNVFPCLLYFLESSEYNV